MVALTYGDARVAMPESKIATKTATKTAAAPRKTWLARFFDALMESRMRQAEREIRLYAPLLRQVRDEQDQLPFTSASNDTPRGGW